MESLSVFADALDRLSTTLWTVGDRQAAVAARRERVTVYDRLTLTDPTTYRPHLANALGSSPVGWCTRVIPRVGC